MCTTTTSNCALSYSLCICHKLQREKIIQPFTCARNLRSKFLVCRQSRNWPRAAFALPTHQSHSITSSSVSSVAFKSLVGLWILSQSSAFCPMGTGNLIRPMQPFRSVASHALRILYSIWFPPKPSINHRIPLQNCSFLRIGPTAFLSRLLSIKWDTFHTASLPISVPVLPKWQNYASRYLLAHFLHPELTGSENASTTGRWKPSSVPKVKLRILYVTATLISINFRRKYCLNAFSPTTSSAPQFKSCLCDV